MIKFFRKIRQQLLTENKFSKYILYAIGEIILVVFGILIALQVNTWNQNLKLEKLENSYYLNILNDLHNDSLEFDRKNKNALRNISKLNNILNFINNNYDFSKTQIDSISFGDRSYADTLALIFSVSQAGFLQFPQIYSNTITDLRSTGNIKLFKNDTLKNSILEYYGRDKLSDQWMAQLLSARVDIEAVINGILNEKERIAYTLPEGLKMSDTDYDSFVKAIKRKRDFKEKIIGMLHIHHRIIMQGNDRIADVLLLMEKIRTELKRK
jgi:uncharacterized protein DUF6090